jgi:hypothetical protein
MEDHLLSHLSERVKISLNQVFARLTEDLDRDIIGNEVLFDQLRVKANSVSEADGKANFDLLEPQSHESLEQLCFLIDRHRDLPVPDCHL